MRTTWVSLEERFGERGRNWRFRFSTVQSLSRVRLFATPWTAAYQASLSITNSWSLLKLMSIESVLLSNHLILCCPLLLPPSIFPSIGVFSNKSVPHIRWPKYWSLSFSINPSNEYSGLISFRIDWLDLLAVQGTLKHFLQHHSSNTSILWHSAFFIVQLSRLYMTSGRCKKVGKTDDRGSQRGDEGRARTQLKGPYELKKGRLYPWMQWIFHLSWNNNVYTAFCSL